MIDPRMRRCKSCRDRRPSGNRALFCDRCRDRRRAEGNRQRCARYYSRTRAAPGSLASPLEPAQIDDVWRKWMDLERIRRELGGPAANIGSALGEHFDEAAYRRIYS